MVQMLAKDRLGARREALNQTDLRPYRDAFQAIEADPAHLLLVVVDNEDVVGTMQLSFIPGLARRGALRAQIEAVRIKDHFRGLGVGAAMFRWVIEEARHRGCALVQLTTDKSRADAHRFYAGLGFVASHEGLKLVL
jgi:GNAT superfamily N-acetyltransferase